MKAWRFPRTTPKQRKSQQDLKHNLQENDWIYGFASFHGSRFLCDNAARCTSNLKALLSWMSKWKIHSLTHRELQLCIILHCMSFAWCWKDLKRISWVYSERCRAERINRGRAKTRMFWQATNQKEHEIVKPSECDSVYAFILLRAVSYFTLIIKVI